MKILVILLVILAKEWLMTMSTHEIAISLDFSLVSMVTVIGLFLTSQSTVLW